MKKSIILGIGLIVAMSSRNDFLDINPHDTFTNTPTYWSNSSNLDNQYNHFLNSYVGYGSAGDGGWFYFKTSSDNQVSYHDNSWSCTNVVSSSGNWSNPLAEIRHANCIIQGLKDSTPADNVKKSYEGIARLNRAWQYYQSVREYGDVPQVGHAVPTDDNDVLYGSRVDHDIVMDNVLDDLDSAAKCIQGSNKQRFTADMALAVKADVTLFEGTYCKYRTAKENAGKGPDAIRAQKYLNKCVSACEALMKKGYKLNDSYQGIYNPIDLSKNPEIIFYKPYSQNVLIHSTVDYILNASGTHGMTEDAFDAYLLLDGKPKATTALDNADAVQADASGVFNVNSLLTVRDKHLTVTTDTVLVFGGKPYSRARSNEFTSTTGYGVAKYDNPKEMNTIDRNDIGKQYTDCPIYWLSVVYLNYVEVETELGNLTQADLDKSVNLLQGRAGLPNMTTTPEADPANNMDVSSLLWEIQRVRRCELMFDNWYRYQDLIRWHQLGLLDSQNHPNIYLGVNLKYLGDPGVDVNADGYMVGSNTLKQIRTPDKKHYFYPVPTGQITLNKELKQNPGW